MITEKDKILPSVLNYIFCLTTCSYVVWIYVTLTVFKKGGHL